MNIEISQRQRGSEETWLDAAYELLTESGVEAVKIMPLARRLGLSRTGFYWHFKDREALLEAMVRRWEDKNTGNLVARTEAYAENICEAMFNLFDCWLDDDLFDARLDLAIRNWARNDPALQTRLDAADGRRKAAIMAMFTRFGYGREEAEVRTMTVIYTQIGYISMQVSEDRAARIARMPAYVEVFTGVKPSERDVLRFMARHDADHGI
ncbi:TetR/AcrR family transcriptional regulator [Jhaorihella thermophila]|uniref:DNA-binding transcriptional regulator, AcrR family n=1 Tax=Jhaorihella thermophila TaxID=488547 RepID=A0A1H5TV92_9RHOB|nr:TetR/AcrR family transcriptional regulator [Jhaorihella thermophila]SEF65961.1 DNA-binding transcriptional regulator, AcrR family [Jhaorihella thermophila]